MDPIFFELRENFNFHTIIIDPSNPSFLPHFSESLILGHLLFKNRIRTKLLLKISKYNCELSRYDEVNSYLSNIGLPHLMTLDSIVNEACKIFNYKVLFNEVFTRTNPKLAFVVNYYNPYGYAFVASAKENGVPSIDIQHGGVPNNLVVQVRFVSSTCSGSSYRVCIESLTGRRRRHIISSTVLYSLLREAR